VHRAKTFAPGQNIGTHQTKTWNAPGSADDSKTRKFRAFDFKFVNVTMNCIAEGGTDGSYSGRQGAA